MIYNNCRHKFWKQHSFHKYDECHTTVKIIWKYILWGNTYTKYILQLETDNT